MPNFRGPASSGPPEGGEPPPDDTGGAVECRSRQDGHADLLGGQRDDNPEIAALGDDPGREPRRPAGGLEGCAEFAGVSERDHRLVTQGCQLDRTTAREGAGRVQRDHDGFAVHHQGPQVARRIVVRTEADQGDVQPTGPHTVEQPVGLAFGNGQLDRRMIPVERTEQPDDPAIRQRLHQTDREPAGDQTGQLRDRLPGAIRAEEQRTGVWQQRLTGRGQRHGSSVPDEQPFLQLCFEALDLLADRRLGDRHPLGRAGEVAFLRDGEKVGQLPKFHKQIL